tara:strand:+ start:651 stop:1250 length:600 start_codon:yes stop_codon:yes gene_type:complete
VEKVNQLFQYNPMPDTFNYAPTVTHDFYCQQCGYNLRLLEKSGKCPECGHRITLSYLQLAQSIKPGYPVYQFHLPQQALLHIAAHSRFVLEEVKLVWQSWVMAREMRQPRGQAASISAMRELGYDQLISAMVDLCYLKHGQGYLEQLQKTRLVEERPFKALLRLMIAAGIMPGDGLLAKQLDTTVPVVSPEHAQSNSPE